MSNVLIGIIGVILFIGLALAGALFLGPRFQESSSSSKASAAVQAVSQVANATELKRLQDGIEPLGISYVNSLVADRYLKKVPQVPNAVGFIVNDEVRTFVKDSSGPTTTANYAIAAFPHDEVGERMCRAVEKYLGRDAASLPTTTQPTHPSGCIDYTGDTGYGTNSFYMVYSRIR